MSNFFNYDAPGAAQIYDKTRVAMGADVIGGMLQVYCGKPLKDIHVLDAGCGSGQYAKVLVDMGVGKISLLDASTEMLNIAKDKLKDAIQHNIVDACVEAVLPDLPFEDGIFDAVMYNQVLHHIDKDWDGKNFPLLEKTLLDTKRILRPKGVLVITTCLPSTFKETIWCTRIHPGIAEAISKCYLSVNQYLDLFAKYSFRCVSAMNFLNTPLTSMNPQYWNPEGPLSEVWRKSANVFDVPGSDKVKEMIDIILDMKEKGTLEKFLIEHDHTSERGLFTFFVCVSS